ncbi:MAG: cytochrome c oxidase subunit II [Nitrospirales bacterium]|nr:cytochrome c oxidase subunit II [Nitrospirales bacterium]
MDYFTSVLSPGTRQAVDILRAFYIVLGVSAFIFAVVAGLSMYALCRFRRREGREPKTFRENVRLEVLWTAIPLLIVTGLFVVAVWIMSLVNPPALGHQPDLTVTAHQWWWGLRYPQPGVTAANEIHLPVGRRLLLRFESGDVIHSFWVPSLGQKIDVIPGHPNHLWLTLERPGVYLGACSSFCGMGHGKMRIRVIAQSTDDFNTWIGSQQQPASPPSAAQAAKGVGVFMEKNCINCHSIAGLVTKGRVAPDLTHVASRETLAAGALTNTPENLSRWLRDPQSVKDCNMPDLGLSDDQVGYLVAYLGGLK